MKTAQEITPQPRRSFFRNLLGVGVALLALKSTKAKAGTGEKVKLLTADGKLVLVDKSVLEKKSATSASNKEVLGWMKNNTTKS